MVDLALFYYCFFFTLVITLGGLFSGFAFKNPLATALFLPIPLTLLFETIRSVTLRQYKQVEKEIAPKPQIRVLENMAFDLRYFFAQKNPVFVATLVLYVIVFTAILFRTGTSYLPAPPFISPVPQDQLIISSR